MLTVSLKFSQTSLIIKELIKYENKFNRKVFHDKENSENQFSIFIFHETLQKGYHEHISVVYTMKILSIHLSRNDLKETFHSVSSPLEKILHIVNSLQLFHTTSNVNLTQLFLLA